MNEQLTFFQWLCEHCYIHLVNGDCTKPDTCHVGLHEWEVDATDENDPLHLFGDMHVTPGMLSEEHHEWCPNHTGAYEADCDCETHSFSWSACDGCGSNLGGVRHAVTGWIKEGE